MKVGAVVLGLVVAAAMAFALFEPIQVLPRIRPAPGFALVDQHGEPFTSETARGSLTLYAFAPLDCGSACADQEAALAEITGRVDDEVDLDGTELHLVTVALDPDPSPARLAAAAERSGADGDRWRWVGGDEVTVRAVVATGFRRSYPAPGTGSAAGDGFRFDPGYVLVDGNGVIRGEYRYRTLAGDADKLLHHLDILAEEVRNIDGPAAVAYEAAHLFLCYP